MPHQGGSAEELDLEETDPGAFTGIRLLSCFQANTIVLGLFSNSDITVGYLQGSSLGTPDTLKLF